MSEKNRSADRFGELPPQRNLERATEMAFDALEHQAEEQFRWLGAELAAGVWQLPVLGSTLEVDVAARTVVGQDKKAVGPPWRIVATHYLAITTQPESREPEVTFADLPTARSYSSVYQGRVVSRLCYTAGRNAETISEAARAHGGRPVEVGDLAFDFDVFPRLTLRLIWYGPDDEFPPSATLLLPGNIELFLCSEDIVVLSESLVARLGGKPF